MRGILFCILLYDILFWHHINEIRYRCNVYNKYSSGCESDPGMMVLCIRDILEWVKSHAQSNYTLKVAYLEVYNEEINDLLGDVNKGNSKNLKIVSEDAVRGAVIGGLVEEVTNKLRILSVY